MYCQKLFIDGSVLIIFIDLRFSSFSFFLVIVLPFLKFIKYKLTEKSFKAKAVKKLWSAHVRDILNYLEYSLLTCLSLKLIEWAGWYVFFCKFHIIKFSFLLFRKIHKLELQIKRLLLLSFLQFLFHWNLFLFPFSD